MNRAVLAATVSAGLAAASVGGSGFAEDRGVFGARPLPESVPQTQTQAPLRGATRAQTRLEMGGAPTREEAEPMREPAGSPTTANIKIENCSPNERQLVRTSGAWLKSNVRLIDRQMGQNGLMSWPGQSREKFLNKLEKPINVVCINERRRCRAARRDGMILTGRTVPVVHQKRVALCANNLHGQGEYVAVLAHEIGHLIRLNAHWPDCVKRHRQPRFSQSLGLAAFHAFQGRDYDAAEYTAHCPNPPAGGSRQSGSPRSTRTK